MSGKEETRSPVVLYPWDVPAALLGLGASLFVAKLWPHGAAPIGGVATVGLIHLRRTLLPRLTPAPNLDRAPPSLGRKIAAYACLIFGGVIALISGMVCWFAFKDAASLVSLLPVVVIFALGALIVSVGLRWIT